MEHFRSGPARGDDRSRSTVTLAARVRARRGLTLVAVAVATAGLFAPAQAQIANGGCESGLTGWTVTPGSSIEALQANDFGAVPIPPPEGSFVCLLSTGPDNIAAPGGDFDSNGVNDFDGSTMSSTFTTTVADETISFEWSFLTDEIGPGGQGQGQYDDLFEVLVDGIPVLTGSVNKPGGISPYPDTDPYDDQTYNVNSAGPTDGSDFGTAAGGGRTEFQRVCLPIANPGVHTILFRVADQGDSAFDSGLLVDAIQVAPSCDPRIQVTDTAGSLLEVKGGTFVFSQVRNKRPAVTFDGGRIAFRSNGNLASDNPNLQEQIWVGDRNGVVHDFTRLTAATGAQMGDPDVSSRGDWVVFSSTGDLTGGNPDLNAEIFRSDVAGGTLSQVTSTTGCSNGSPVVNENGTRIAYVSDCNGGGDEIVFWDGSTQGAGSTGCTNRLPSISSDPDGRYVTFVTDCDGSQYAGLSNPDGGNEIVQWDTVNGSFLQVTDTPAGASTDVPSASDDGRYVAFVSTVDFDTGQNPGGALTVFRYDRSGGGSYLQLAPFDPLSVYTLASIDTTGDYVAAERLDALTSAFEIVLFEAAQPGTIFTISSDGPSVGQASPAVSSGGGEVQVYYLSNGDVTANNPDGNDEVWRSGSSLMPPVVATYCSTPNLTIPGTGTVDDFLTVTDTGSLTDLDVFVRVSHDWVGDLQMILRHVDTGTQARMLNRPGRPPGFGCSGDDIETTFDDEAALPAEDECVTPGPIAIEGTFTPDQPLSRFDGEDLSGDWRMRVRDRAANGTGVLLEWCLVPSTP